MGVLDGETQGMMSMEMQTKSENQYADPAQLGAMLFDATAQVAGSSSSSSNEYSDEDRKSSAKKRRRDD